jgi:hypothetical protein
LFVIAMFSAIMALIRSEEASLWAPLVIFVAVAFVYLAVLSATRLTTTVSASEISLEFRLGWPSKTIDRAAIVGAAIHRNIWIAGWGIRKVTRGWMWNVWGLDAVELELDSGRVFRIGTDDPAGLLAALRS